MKKRALCITIALTILFSSCMAKQKVPEQITDEVISYDSVVNHTLREEEKPAAQEKKKIEKFQEDNPDVIAMINIPDTLLDFPVMYRDGEEEYYLRKDINGEYDIGGLPSMQQRCSLYENNIIIYGHYFKTGEMFGCLHNYIDNPDYYNNHKDIFISTPIEEQVWRIFAVCIMTVEEEGFVYNSSDHIAFETKKEFERYRSVVEKKNAVATGETIEFGDRLLVLSTCFDYSGGNKRVVAFAKEKK